MRKKAWSAEAAEIVLGNTALARAGDALVSHFRDPKNAQEPALDDFGEFDELELKAVYTFARMRAGSDFDARAFVKAMDATAPVLSRRRITDPPLDLWRMLAQPEMLRLWGDWNGRTGGRGRDPGYFAKALLVTTAVLGTSAHFDDNWHLLTSGYGGGLKEVFDWVETHAAALRGRRPQAFGKKTYTKALEQIGLIVDPFRNRRPLVTDDCTRANIALVRQLHDFYPAVGLRLGVDATAVKAWVRQVGLQPSPERERSVRRRAVNASPRFIEGRRGGRGRFWRGYYFVVLYDLATHVPVSWNLYPAGEGFNAHRALRFVLNDVFEKWPACPTEIIVADRELDNVAAVRNCAVNFGIHLIAGRDVGSWTRQPTTIAQDESATIGRFDGRGVVLCRQHGEPMGRAGAEFIGRRRRRNLGLEPGEPSNPRDFRLRLSCPVGGGVCDRKPHLHMDRDWPALSYYPHTTLGGRADLHALRLAMYARRNTCESGFGALKLAHKLGLDSTDRTHTDNEQTVETLLSFGLLSRTAFVSACERADRGLIAADPPPTLRAVLTRAVSEIT